MATGGADAPIDIIEIDDSDDGAMEIESKSEVSKDPVEKESASEPPECVHVALHVVELSKPT